MAATIKKIAELAGVSIGTVDRVINNRGRVSPAVEARVRSIIQEVGYTPNLMAKSLSLKRRSPKIGVIFHLERSGFLDEVEAGLRQAEAEMSDFGVEVLVRASRNFDAADQMRIIQEMLSQGVNAIAITPINDPQIAGLIDQLIRRGYPIFCFINDIVTQLPHAFVGPDAHQTGRIAAGLFSMLSCGREERLGVVTPSLKMLGHAQKLEGLRDAILQRQAPIRLLDVCELPGGNDVDIYKAVSAYLDANPTLTALWYATSICDGGITALQEHGLLEKTTIITLDLQPFIVQGLEQFYIRATISQNPRQQGYQVIKTIFNALLQERYDPRSVDVPCEILIRENYRQMR